MTMPPDEPTLGEVARTLGRFADDTRSRFSELSTSIGLMVTRDLYEAHRAAMQEDIRELQVQLKADQDRRATELKAEQDRRAADRRMIAGAVIAAVLSLIVTIVGGALLLALGLKP